MVGTAALSRCALEDVFLPGKEKRMGVHAIDNTEQRLTISYRVFVGIAARRSYAYASRRLHRACTARSWLHGGRDESLIGDDQSRLTALLVLFTCDVLLMAVLHRHVI